MSILQIKISLRGSKPRIWRRFLVEDSISFYKLHSIIQDVMGWEDYHLWEFKIGDYTITPDEEGCNAAEIAIDKLMKSDEFLKMIKEQKLSKGLASLNINKMNEMLKKAEDEEKKKNHFNLKTSINKLLNKEKIKFDYCYDFGDNWEHSVIVEKILDKDSSKKYPICIAGEMSCPLEDCGGVWGYYEMLEIKKNKNHPEYQERIIDWLGEDFDFEKFDIDRVNERL